MPVYNVSVPVLGEDFWVFEMTGRGACRQRSTSYQPAVPAPPLNGPRRSLVIQPP